MRTAMTQANERLQELRKQLALKDADEDAKVIVTLVHKSRFIERPELKLLYECRSRG